MLMLAAMAPDLPPHAAMPPPVEAPRLSLRRRIEAWRGGSVNRRLFSAARVVAALSALVKLAGLLRDLMLAARYGTGDAFEAYLAALLLPTLFVNVLGGAFATGIVPSALSLRVAGDRQGERALVRQVLGLGVVALCALILGAALAAPALMGILAAGFDAEKRRLAGDLMILVLPLTLLQCGALAFGALLNARERFALVAALPLLTPIAMIAFLAASGGTLALRPLLAGLWVGALLEVAVLLWLARRQGIAILPRWPRWRGLDPATRAALAQYWPAAAGLLLMSGNAVVDQAVAAWLAPGSLAALSYGSKLTLGLMGLAAGALGVAALPYFADHAAQHGARALRRPMAQVLAPVLALATLLALAIAAVSEPLTRLLFERGAFGPADTIAVAGVQVVYVLQMPFYVGGILITRGISALRGNRALAAISLGGFVANALLDVVLGVRFGVVGIAAATTLVYALTAGASVIAFLRLTRRA